MRVQCLELNSTHVVPPFSSEFVLLAFFLLTSPALAAAPTTCNYVSYLLSECVISLTRTHLLSMYLIIGLNVTGLQSTSTSQLWGQSPRLQQQQQPSSVPDPQHLHAGRSCRWAQLPPAVGARNGDGAMSGNRQ